MIDMNRIVGSHDILMVTFDTLRHDVAVGEMQAGGTPNLRRWFGSWEKRHSPGSFTYAAHCAFFAGFLPTPARPGRHERLFALRFAGSETTGSRTLALDAPDIVAGLASKGYHTACIGGVGFFKKENALSEVLPGLFRESHWDESMGVTDPRSTEHQVERALEILRGHPHQRVFLFLNLSALHQPNRFYLPGASEDSLESHAAALRYVDSCLPPLMDAFRARGRTLCLFLSDHGTAYGDDGYTGHRLAHECVWNVPYAEFVHGEEDA